MPDPPAVVAGYDPTAPAATPRDAELRIDLFFPANGTRRTIWEVEDADKAVPAADPDVEVRETTFTRTISGHSDWRTDVQSSFERYLRSSEVIRGHQQLLPITHDRICIARK